jgi:hypothetical protein
MPLGIFGIELDALNGIWRVLKSILCVITNLAYTLLAIMIMAFNAVTKSIAVVAGAAIGLLPEMPLFEGLPSQFVTGSAWLNWMFPVGTLLAFMTFALTAWVLWHAVAIALRWAKALD